MRQEKVFALIILVERLYILERELIFPVKVLCSLRYYILYAKNIDFLHLLLVFNSLVRDIKLQCIF